MFLPGRRHILDLLWGRGGGGTGANIEFEMQMVQSKNAINLFFPFFFYFLKVVGKTVNVVVC